jgi:hypothetical protein
LLGVNFDLSGLKGLLDLPDIMSAEALDANRRLAASAHAHAVELATHELHTRRQTFIDALRFYEAEGVAVLELDAKALWIEDGVKKYNMLESLLASPKAKTGKNGQRYISVPFDHSPGHGATNTTPYGLDLVNAVKGEMKRQKIPWAKIERDDQGRPRLGKLHSLDVNYAPLKTSQGPGQGRGPMGDVRQGPNERQRVGGGPAGGGTPFLKGVGVYQTLAAGGGVRRSVMTFRTATSDQMGEELWDHPGLEAKKILARTATWAEDELLNRIMPEMIEKIVARL